MVKKILITALAVGMSTAVFAAAIEGFERSNYNSSPSFASISDGGQSPNSINIRPNGTTILTESTIQSELHFTEGSKSGEFRTTWKLGAEATDTGNPFDTTLFSAPVWGHRFYSPDVTRMTGNSFALATAVLRMDVFNPNNYPINVSLAVNSTGFTGLRRGPFLTVQPNSSGEYEWNVMAEPVRAIYSGTNTWGTATSIRVASVLVVCDDEPDNADFVMYVDNIRNTMAQEDVIAPARVKVLSTTQGSAPGKLLLKWEGVTDSDLAGYRIYVKDSSAVSGNSLVFDTTPSYEVPKTATSFEIDVATEQIQFVAVTSYDNATPEKNESERLSAFAVRLKADGSAVENHVILDHDRYVSGLEFNTTQGYSHGIIYNAFALDANNLYFDSASARAVDTNAFVLNPNPSGIVIWSNLLDGTAGSSVALSDESVNALSNFYYSFGNLMISGAGLAEDLNTRGPLQGAFLNEVLQSSLTSENANRGTIVGSGILFPNFNGTYSTVESVYTNQVSGSILSNEQLEPVGTSVGDSKYVNDSGELNYAIVANTNRVVQLGFAFESLGIAGDLNGSKAARATLLNDIITYLLSGSDVADWNLY